MANGAAMDQRTSLIALADALAAHQGVTHFAISMRALGKGDFFRNLKAGRDCRTTTAERVLAYFDAAWPDGDLAWPTGIHRPSNSRRAA